MNREQFSPETREGSYRETSVERQPDQATVRFSFRRHGAKESEGADPALTPPGRLQAENEGKRMQPTPDVAVGRGSPRHRTEETVQRIIGAARPERITPMMTAQEVEAEINREFKEARDKGLPIRKTLADERLNFQMTGAW